MARETHVKWRKIVSERNVQVTSDNGKLTLSPTNDMLKLLRNSSMSKLLCWLPLGMWDSHQSATT